MLFPKVDVGCGWVALSVRLYVSPPPIAALDGMVMIVAEMSF